MGKWVMWQIKLKKFIHQKIRKRTEIMLLSDNTPIEEIVNTSDSQSEGDYSPPLKIEKKW